MICHRLIISIIFLVSALLKLLDYSATVEYFSRIFPVPYWIYEAGVGVIILLELILSLLLLYTKSEVVLNVTLIFIGFFICLTILLIVKKYTNCGCFGTRISIPPAVTLFKNVILILLLLNIKNKGIVRDEV